MAVIDPLTGLYNRRYALQHLSTISARAAAEGTPFSILMMDLDEFKSVNDLYGHAAGDDVLCEFSRRLQENVRGIDLVARIGGEEFFVAMPGTSAKQAALVAERLRHAIETRPFKVHDADDPVHVTISIGVAASDVSQTSSRQIMKNADTALYSAKNNGRNRVNATPLVLRFPTAISLLKIANVLRKHLSVFIRHGFNSANDNLMTATGAARQDHPLGFKYRHNT